jgi:hypothetical protein
LTAPPWAAARQLQSVQDVTPCRLRLAVANAAPALHSNAVDRSRQLRPSTTPVRATRRGIHLTSCRHAEAHPSDRRCTLGGQRARRPAAAHAPSLRVPLEELLLSRSNGPHLLLPVRFVRRQRGPLASALRISTTASPPPDKNVVDNHGKADGHLCCHQQLQKDRRSDSNPPLPLLHATCRHGIDADRRLLDALLLFLPSASPTRKAQILHRHKRPWLWRFGLWLLFFFLDVGDLRACSNPILAAFRVELVVVAAAAAAAAAATIVAAAVLLLPPPPDGYVRRRRRWVGGRVLPSPSGARGAESRTAASSSPPPPIGEDSAFPRGCRRNPRIHQGGSLTFSVGFSDP